MPAISTTQTFAANEQITSTKLTNVLALSVVAPGAVSADNTLTVTGGGQLQVGTLKTENFPAAYVNSFVPTGAIMAFGMNSVPTGWLACNGQTTAGYTALAALVGANVPDLRGYFVRGSGINGDTVESGAFGAKQTASLLNHTHSGTTGTISVDHSHSYTRYNTIVNNLSLGGNVDGIWQNTVAVGTGGVSANHVHGFTTGNPSEGGGNETRPANIALLYCIKY